jgi:hypothetical protein
MHFMRCLYRNKLLENGYELRKLVKIPEAEKKRVRSIYDAKMKNQMSSGKPIVMGNDDSSAYYKKVLQQPNGFNTLYKAILPTDSVAYAVDSVTVGFYFEDYLDVTYTKKKEPNDYVAYQHKQYADNSLISQLTMPNKMEVHVFANGSYFNGVDMLTQGYWAWSEKMANMLPYDYWPLKK